MCSSAELTISFVSTIQMLNLSVAYYCVALKPLQLTVDFSTQKLLVCVPLALK